MLYNGQLDIIVANPLTEALLQTVDWRGLQAYKAAQRTVWKVNADDDEVAGYVRQVDNFYQVCSNTALPTKRMRSWILVHEDAH